MIATSSRTTHRPLSPGAQGRSGKRSSSRISIASRTSRAIPRDDDTPTLLVRRINSVDLERDNAIGRRHKLRARIGTEHYALMVERVVDGKDKRLILEHNREPTQLPRREQFQASGPRKLLKPRVQDSRHSPPYRRAAVPNSAVDQGTNLWTETRRSRTHVRGDLTFKDYRRRATIDASPVHVRCDTLSLRFTQVCNNGSSSRLCPEHRCAECAYLGQSFRMTGIGPVSLRTKRAGSVRNSYRQLREQNP